VCLNSFITLYLVTKVLTHAANGEVDLLELVVVPDLNVFGALPVLLDHFIFLPVLPFVNLESKLLFNVFTLERLIK